VVVDTSALLAVLFDEPDGPSIARELDAHARDLVMSTVNLAETLILVRDRQPTLYSSLERRILESPIRFVAPDVAQARIASEARIRFPLNLGDCFAYALASVENLPVLTLDADFRKTDVEVRSPGSQRG
jgi:ribonuclease VapC